MDRGDLYDFWLILYWLLLFLPQKCYGAAPQLLPQQHEQLIMMP